MNSQKTDWFLMRFLWLVPLAIMGLIYWSLVVA